MYSRQERLSEFIRRLAAAEQVETRDDALELISVVLNAVEDEFTDIPFDPEHWMDDGRMYPPQEDSAYPVEGHPDVLRYRSRLHNTFVSSWGAIEIRTVRGDILLSKPSKTGREVWE